MKIDQSMYEMLNVCGKLLKKKKKKKNIYIYIYIKNNSKSKSGLKAMEQKYRRTDEQLEQK